MRRYSVVIPVYNAQEHIEGCLQSVFNQRGVSDYEVLLIDDGSTDGSAELCDTLAQKYENVHTVHQHNQGVSAARNAGIQAARGQYVLFLDSDDAWDPDLLSLVDSKAADVPDMVEFGLQKVCNGQSISQIIPVETLPAGESGIDYLNRLLAGNEMPVASSCLTAYRREFLQDNELYFSVGVTYAEDLDFRIRCLERAKVVKTVAKPLYCYQMWDESATHTLSAKKLTDLLVICAGIYRRIPSVVFANYYCMNILILAKLSAAQARQLKPVLDENADILKHIDGRKERIARTLFYTFGWYRGAKLIQFMVSFRNGQKRKEKL